MGNEQDRLSLCAERAHNIHQLVDFLRRQDGGGLVKNQDFIVPVEHFQDFDALLHTDGNILYLRIRIYLQTVFLGKLQNPFPGFFTVDDDPLSRLCAQNDVIQHCKALHQLEMLVNHANVQGSGIVGILNFHHLAVFFDNALLRLV